MLEPLRSTISFVPDTKSTDPHLIHSILPYTLWKQTDAKEQTVGGCIFKVYVTLSAHEQNLCFP